MKKQDMNLLLTYKAELQRKANKISPIKMYVVIIISAALIVGAYSIKLVLDNLSIKDEIKSVETYINSPHVVEKMSELSKINENIKLLDDIETEALTLKDVIDYIPHFDSKVLDIIYYERPSTIKFTDIDYLENRVSLDFVSKNVSDVSNYVLKLQRTFSFADVSYEGYVYDDEIKQYTGTIVCLLKGGN